MSTAEIARRKLTPRQVASQFGIAVDKVISWIQSGELRAINGATTTATRPIYLIDVADLAAFEASREIVPSAPSPRRRRRTSVSPKYYAHE